VPGTISTIDDRVAFKVRRRILYSRLMVCDSGFVVKVHAQRRNLSLREAESLFRDAFTTMSKAALIYRSQKCWQPGNMVAG
jgi:hypothetical protein